MAKYQEDVKVLLDKIGGKANIQAVSHCMTRMRFVLADPKRADERRSKPSRRSRVRSRRPASIRSLSATMWQTSIRNSPSTRASRA